jgi:hypothetical protein
MARLAGTDGPFKAICSCPASNMKNFYFTSSRDIPFVSGPRYMLINVIIAPITRMTAGDSHKSFPSMALIKGILCAHQT